MADEGKPSGIGSKDPLEEFGEKVKEKIDLGRFVFGNVIAPRAKEVFETVKDAAGGQLKKARDSLDPTRGLVRNATEARNWLMEKGLSLKRANEIIIETVSKAVKETKPEAKKPLNAAKDKEEKRNG